MPPATAWLLGDQLHEACVGDADRVLMVEATRFADRHRYHPLKLTLVFSAMRHFRDRLRDDGYEVAYERAATFREGVGRYLDRNPDARIVVRRPASHDAAAGLRSVVDAAGGELEVRTNPLFLCPPGAFDEWATDREPPYRQESFYRFMRRRTGYLMEDGEPAGGEWNYDDRNRESPPDGYEPPRPEPFEPDALTRETAEWVAQRFDDHWGSADLANFVWPVTRSAALAGLEDFVENRLPGFGPYQDAMVTGEWAMHHSLLSAPLNLGLLHPREVVERALAALERDEVPLNSVEGFVRQLIGWREFLRHVYRVEMPELARANQLGAERELPPAYWDPAATDMVCLGDAVAGVRDRGYAHHIERLMVLSNFALLHGVDPAALNEWFHLGFVDAYHWVTTPNVVEMGSYGAGVFATKPYASSANYIDRMSDHCGGCPYDPDATVGEGACPFNSLYWDFLARNEGTLRSNHRMGLMYGHLDDKRESGALDDIRDRAAEVRKRAADGDL